MARIASTRSGSAVISMSERREWWPEGYDRTDPEDRGPYPGDLSLGHREAFESIEEELAAWGAVLDRVEFAATSYARNSNIPHKSADVADPGVAVYFRREAEHADRGYALACDRWESLRENARAISLYVRRKRLAERCEVSTAEEEFSTAALPSPEEEALVAEKPPHKILGCSPAPTVEEIRESFRQRVKEVHPDNGGTDREFKRVKEARDDLLDRAARADGGQPQPNEIRQRFLADLLHAGYGHEDLPGEAHEAIAEVARDLLPNRRVHAAVMMAADRIEEEHGEALADGGRSGVRLQWDPGEGIEPMFTPANEFVGAVISREAYLGIAIRSTMYLYPALIEKVNGRADGHGPVSLKDVRAALEEIIEEFSPEDGTAVDVPEGSPFDR